MIILIVFMIKIISYTLGILVLHHTSAMQGFFINDRGFPKFMGTRLGVPAVRIGLCRYRREGGP